MSRHTWPGCLVGGQCGVELCLVYPHLAKALVVAATGAGTTNREKFLEDGENLAQSLLDAGMEVVAHDYALGPTRTQFLRKGPKGWEEFQRWLAAHSALGSALTYRGVEMKRPTIYALEDRLRQLSAPTLILIGDEDEPCIEPAIFLKRCIPRAGLAVFPQSGHAINLEEPDRFNRTVLDFLIIVENGGWVERAG